MPTKLVVDCSTGIATEVELTEEEVAQLEADAKASADYQAELLAEQKQIAEAKASAVSKLSALGLTEDEINALIS